MSEKTSIEVSLKTWQALNQRKRRPGESFDDVIQRILADGPEASEKPSRARANTDLLDVARDVAPENWNEDKIRSLAAGLEYLRDQGEATAGEIATAARDEVPVMADKSSWRSNVWNNVGKALRERGVVELAERHTGTWRWVGQ